MDLSVNFILKDDYIFYSKIDETTLHFTDKINILEEMQHRDSYEHNICLDYNFFLNDIKNSYKDNDSIRHQFSVDLERCDVYLNRHIVKDKNKIYMTTYIYIYILIYISIYKYIYIYDSYEYLCI